MAIAILGGGILGTCTALELADRGYRVVVFDRNADLLCEASRYNEGKLHLGFVYAADPSFRTAQRMIQGASQFMEILKRWIPTNQLRALPAHAFDYVVHRETMVSVSQVEWHFSRVAQAMAEVLPRNPVAGPSDPTRRPWRRLGADELSSRYDPDLIEAAYETCEIAVDPWLLSNYLRAAVRDQPRIEFLPRAWVQTVEDRPGGGYDVVFDRDGLQREGPFEGVVNALWANRPALDQRYGLPPGKRWFTRRKLGVNVQAGPGTVQIPSVTVMLGPFGDVVVYGCGRIYLSWYPTCMIGSTTGLEETDWNAVLREVDCQQVARKTIESLGRICPAVMRLAKLDGAAHVVNGGSIFALGESDIVDPRSQLHQRSDSGVNERGAYLSVDTAKYTLGPSRALEAADRMCAVSPLRS